MLSTYNNHNNNNSDNLLYMGYDPFYDPFGGSYHSP